MSNLGALVVRMVLDGLGAYKADLDKAAQTTSAGANKIEQATDGASKGITRMGGAMGGAAGTAVELAGAAGLAGAAAGALAAGIGLAAYAAFQGSKEQQAYNQALILTGNISGTTASQMQGMAAGIDAVVGTHYQAAEALTAMASTGQVAGQNLQTFAQVAVQAQRVVGTSVEDTAKVFAQLGEEPVKASIKLNQSMNYLTASTFAQIKAAQDLGDSETAASIAQNAYAAAMAGRTEQIKANLGTLERGWIGVKDLAKEAWDAMLGLGRPAGAEQQLAAQRNTVAMLEQQVAKGGLAAGNSQKLLDAARATLEVMGESARLDAKAASWRASQAQSEKAKIAWMQEGEKYQSKQERLEGVIAAIRFQGAQAGATELEIEKRINVEREKAASKPGRADNSAARELEKEAALMATLSGVNADYLQQLDRLVLMRDQGNMSEERYVELVTELIAKQPMAKKLMDDATRADALAAKQMGESNAEYVKGLDTLDKSIEKLQSETEKELAKAAALGLTKVAAADLAAVELERDADGAERRANMLIGLGLEGETTKKYQDQAKALRDLAAAKRGTALRETELETEKEISAERKRGWEETDRLAREAFVNQEISAQRVGDVLKKALKSALYEATLKPMAFQIYMGSTGGGGVLGAAGSTASSLSSAGSLAALSSTFGSSLSAGFGATVSSFGAATGVAIEGGLASIATGTSSAIAGGLGQIAGALGPYALAAVALYAMFQKGEYVKGTGSATAVFDSKGVTTAKNQFGNSFDFQTAEADKYVASLVSGYASAAYALGIKNAGGSFSYGSNNSDGGKFGINVGVGSTNYAKTDIKASPEALQLEASRAVFAALQGSELPAYLAKVFNGITASTATQGDIDAALTYAGSLKQIRDALTETRKPLQVLRDTVAESFAMLGTSAETFKADFVAAIDQGISPDKLAQFQALGANLDALTQNAKESADKLAETNKSWQNQLDLLTGKETERSIALRDATDASTRAIMEQVYAQQDLKSSVAEMSRVAGIVSGQKTTQLLNAAGLPVDASGSRHGQALAAGSSERVMIPKTIAELNASLDAFGGRSYQNADASGVSEYARSLGLTAQNLQSVLDKLASDDRAAQAAFSSDGTKGDDNARYAAMATGGGAADTSARDAANALASERKGLQDQLDELLLSVAEKSARAREAIGEENRALFDQLEQVRASKTEAEEAARALEKFNGAMRGLTDTNTDLQAQLLKLQGDDAGSAQLLRNKALAALTQGVTTEDAARLTAQYDANEALKAQIEGLTKAQQDAASAAANLKSTWASIATGLMKEVDRIRGVMAESSTDSLAALQSRFAIANAQARAGDQTAAGNLTSYSGQLSSEIAEQAGSRNEMVRMQAQLAQSLQDTAIVLGAPVSPVNTPPVINTEKLEASFATLAAEIVSLKSELSAINTNTKRGADASEMLVAIAP